MAKKPPPGTTTIHFEAALPHTGHAFKLNREGEATLILVVPPQAAKPLAQAMAAQVLNDTTFAVALTYPDPAPATG